ncbi:RNA polymerase sigma factor [Ruminococcus flavefaciens]|jgi:RNA polymerase sigma-70 factor (ECF subfamily)|uniref:RNA polymerase sigma-70 factor, ECF subfamily n=1 Tax=Ruminococcus flavefaciens TaxID=1265 RepID=A0A1K1PDR7_RUMFL|nr:RNA polymerase sigma factor [Ruminococcus flavefaciens]SFW45625.1 RNA polymerase sigma-70 factor, ECF subfamily [Ruminococcus flavefaciens]
MDNGASSYSRYLVGDDSALGDIVREYKDGLTIYLNSFTNNIHDAEELMEETFFKLAYKKPKYTGKSSFKTWLFSIGRNLAIDYLRRMKKKGDTSLDECSELNSGLDIEENYIKEEQKLMIHRALKKLRSQYSQAICLTYIEGFSNSEAACIMHKSSRQMTNLLYQAKKALREELEKEGIKYAGMG